MECKKCGAQLPEGCSFCPACGEKVEVKKICHNCGKEVEGRFCAFCGTQYDEDEKTPQTENEVKVGPAREVAVNEKLEQEKALPLAKTSVLNKVLTIVSAGCLFLGVILMHFLSFGLYDYFDGFFKVEGAAFVSWFPEVISLLAIIASSIVIMIMAIISIVRFVKVAKGGEADLSTMFSVSLAMFLLSMITVVNTFAVTAESNYYGMEFKTNLSADTTFCFVFACILGVASYVLKMIMQGKEVVTLKNIAKPAAALVGLILSVIAIFVGIKNNFVFSVTNGNYSYVTKMTAVGFAQNVTEMGWIDGSAISIVNTVFSMIALLFLFLFANSCIKVMFKKEQNFAKSIVMASISIFCTLMWLVFSFTAVEDYMYHMGYTDFDFGFSASATGAVVALVMSFFMLGVSIAGAIMSKDKETAKA